MKTKEKVMSMLLAARIEYHWWFILHCRKRGERLIGDGEPLNSGRLLRLSRRMDRHGMIAKAYEKEYKARYMLQPTRDT